ncbi:LysR family transcriptional regulator [Yinghuangia seranimata]|uniref:LysR family transcriptional regulator n=1 Tax=Yinghuangia seranimata TaxID=408067 RepID=UPI00248A9E61|nr:LysR family transcriptional regulator [Yinghuangia seranimata]MDI2132649.1 LysR family transcriptional regulator [Yinghuangia seranimata]
MNFTLVQLRYFVAAAQHRSMTGASRELMVSQSAISAAIAHLEREFGVQLLVRHHAKGLSLTASGERFLNEARGLLGHADEMAAAAKAFGGSLRGHLTLGCAHTVAPYYLPPLLAEFAVRCPDVEVRVSEADDGDTLREHLLDGGCELALMYDQGEHEALDGELLARVPPHVIVSSAHPLAEEKAISLHALADEPMVLLDLPHSRDYFVSLTRRVGFHARVRFRTRSTELVRALVAAGQGFAILNQRPATDTTYDGGRVVALELTDDLPALRLVLAQARGVRQTRRAAAFAAVCRDWFLRPPLRTH